MPEMNEDKPKVPELRNMTFAEWAGIDLEGGKNRIAIKRSRLCDFLYILCRDHLPMGVIEEIMFDFVDTELSSYCNTYLEEYVCDLADRLLDLERPITDWKHMHKSADSTVKWCGEQNRPK